MNKDIKKFADHYALNSISKTNFYGVIKEYEVNLYFSIFNATTPLQLIFTCVLDNQIKEQLNAYISNCPNKLTRIEFTSYGFTINTNGFTVKKAVNDLYKVTDDIVSILSSNNVIGFDHCPFTSLELTDENSCYIIKDNSQIRVHKDYAEEHQTRVKEEKEKFVASPNNYLKGFCGALIGAVVGAFLSIILYLVGYVSAWCSIIAAVLGYYLYKKMGGKSNYMSIIIIAATTLIMMLLVTFIVYIISANNILVNTSGYDQRGFEAFKFLMNYDGPIIEGSSVTFKSLFVRDMVLSGFFSILGIAISAIDIVRRIKTERPR